MSLIENATQKVTLNAADERVELTCVRGYGIATISIEDADFSGSGAAASFVLAGNAYSSQITTTASVAGADGEKLVVTWPNGKRPMLSFSGRVNPEFLPKRYIVYAGMLSIEPKIRQ